MSIKSKDLLQDILDFQQSSSNERKTSIASCFGLLDKTGKEWGDDSEKYKNMLKAIKALDALHHLAKENILCNI